MMVGLGSLVVWPKEAPEKLLLRRCHHTILRHAFMSMLGISDQGPAIVAPLVISLYLRLPPDHTYTKHRGIIGVVYFDPQAIYKKCPKCLFY